MASDQQQGLTDFKSLQEGVQKSLVSATRSVNRIAAEDLAFQRAVNPDVAKQLDDKTTRLLALSTRLMQSASRACGVRKAPKLEDAEDVDVQWRQIVDVVDSVLEKADTALDEYTGLVKRKDPPTSESAANPKKARSTTKVVRNANITKPQHKFLRAAENFPKDPWKPFIEEKPHALVPLEKSLEVVTKDNGDQHYKNPYEHEIQKMEYPERVYEATEPIPYQPAETTSATWVDTWEGVLDMLEELKKAKEIAVDLEHHDMRTYHGLVCLMQVSTRKQDWIVDTLQPWRHKLSVLNEVFADPSIIKVLHGAHMDMQWLQRDLGIYVNGLFDTFFACQQLYPKASLAFLLSKFVNFDADKRYQLADWRMRPIPEEMLEYARSDTHYLLYIYDRVRNDLIEGSDRSDPEKDLIGKALQKSRELSLYRHENVQADPETGAGARGWYGYIMNHAHIALDSEQFTAFKALWNWRDRTARAEDENPMFILTPQKLHEIARAKAPDAKALHSLLPFGSLAKARVNDIWEAMQAARAKGGPSLLQFLSSLSPGTLEAHSSSRRSRATVAAPEAGLVVSVERMGKSQLFGEMPISSRWEGSGDSVEERDDYVPFPWQRFVEQVAGEEATIEEEAAAQEAPNGAEVEAAKANGAAEADDSEEEFTLKKGRKRKSDAVEEEDDDETSSSGEDEESEQDEGEKVAASGIINMSDDDEPTYRPPGAGRKARPRKKKKDAQAIQKEKAMREEAKKARRTRKLEKRAKTQQEQEKKKKFEAVPFDYSQAASVVNAKREQQQQQQQNGAGRKKKEVFDPYSKTGDDGMKGARKAPPIKGERSATFRK